MSLISLLLLQPGIPEMNEAKQEISRSFFSARDASLVLAAIFGLVGAVRIYHNWQMGKDRITTDVAGWFYSALFMILLGGFLPGRFRDLIFFSM